MITTDKNLLVKLDRLIGDNFVNQAFTVETICQALSVRRSQLHRILKDHTDLSTSLYIRKRRLLKAKPLLMTTDWRISEVADVVGITNPQNFSTYFIEAFGVSPTEFRKLPQSQPEPFVIVPAPKPARSMKVDAMPTASAAPPFNRTMLGYWQGLVYALGVVGIVFLVSVGLYGWQQPKAEKMPRQTSQNPTARTFYLQGKQLLVTRTTANLRESLVRSSRALALDSTYADAYAGEATANLLLPTSVGLDRDKKYRLAE